MINTYYPFTAIVGQDCVKKALIYNLIEPRIGGVLLCGEKGTAKSTIVRALAALSEQKVVDLPLNVTEDMLVGSIDFERAVHEGVRAFSGGLLERAHDNILYVDEVNLLSDGIVSTLICAAISGVNIVEREGISHSHSCQFALVGTMNPEEGKLRPQFLDRFGLYVDVVGERDVELRAEIIRRRLDYERNSIAFRQNWAEETQKLKRQIVQAKRLIVDIEIDPSIRALAAQYASHAKTEGNRAELVLVRTASAVAAWNGRSYVIVEDLKEAALYVLPHRRKEENPPEEAPTESNQAENKSNDDQQEPTPPNHFEEQEGNDGAEIEIPAPLMDEGNTVEEQLVEGEEIHLVSALPAIPRDRLFRRGSGRRSKTKSGSNKGRYASYTQHYAPHQRDLALDATLRAAAPYQKGRDRTNCAVALKNSDLRYKVRENHVGATIVFVVDASGSMGAQNRMKATKEAILSMLLDSYQKRDQVGMIAFRDERAETLLEITRSVDLAEKQLQSLPTGGRTPLATGLYHAWQLLKARALKDPEMLPVLVLVTDGRANKGKWTDDSVEDALRVAKLISHERIHSVVIDTEKEFISLHIARLIAESMNAVYYKVDELKGDQLQAIVRNRASLVGQDVV